MLAPIINRIIYQPGMTAAHAGFTPAALSVDFEAVELVTVDGVTITGWYMKAPDPRGLVLYLHGNAGNRRDWAQIAPEFVGRGYNLFLPDYRGYGDSQGKPSEQGLFRDGDAAWAWLNERAEREGLPAYILGKSLGSGVATYLAATHSPAGLILDSAFTSMSEVIAHHARWLPRFLIPSLFQSLARAEHIACPTLVLHGDQDDLVPLTHGLQLYDRLHAPKALGVIPGAGHNDIDTYESYTRWVMSFLSRPLHFVAATQDISDEALRTYRQRVAA
jgi:fermentation-respiration switch protein FrsA (DUF1100 family)